MGGKRTVITAEEVELHNEAGGFWTIVNGKVYDLESAEVTCIQTLVVYRSITFLFMFCLFNLLVLFTFSNRFGIIL